MNLVCTALAIYINLRDYMGKSNMSSLDLGSLVTITIHLVVSMWLYMVSKMIRTMRGSLSRAFAAISISAVDCVTVTLTLILGLGLMYPGHCGSDPDSNYDQHPCHVDAKNQHEAQTLASSKCFRCGFHL